MLLRRIALAGLLLGLVGALCAAYWIDGVEQQEHLLESDNTSLDAAATQAGSTRVSARLATHELGAGQQATFEICMLDAPANDALRGAFDIAVFGLEPMRLMLRVPLDDAHLALLKRNAQAACLPLGGGKMDRDGVYSIDVVWPKGPPSDAIRRMPLWTRTLIRDDVPPKAWFVALGLGLLLLTSLFFAMPAGQGRTQQEPASLRLGLAALVVLVGVFALLQIPTQGSAAGYLKGVAVAVFQIGATWAVVRFFDTGDSFRALGLQKGAQSKRWLLIAPIAGVLFAAIARRALHWIPSTGVAPIETFISWPSGLLALAILGAAAPIAEEVFFRGYLFRVFGRWGVGAALALSTIAFTVFHLAQSWGNWGGVLAIAIAGLGFGVVRAWSGSAWAAAAAHITYNLSLSLGSYYGLSL